MRKILVIAILLASVSALYSQENWIKYPNNPVLKRDTVIANLPNDLIAISDPWIIKEGVVYKMWYTCGGFNYPSDSINFRSRICYCESSDGIAWTKYSGNPVLDVSYNGGWDSLGVETVSILIDSVAPSNQRYKMWYAGQYFNSYRYDFGYAYSADGKSWTKHPSQVLQVGNSTAWDGGFIEGPSVLKDGSIYKMWYTGYDLTNGKVNTGYATSSDGIVWTKYSGNPVLHIGSVGWDTYKIQDPQVVKIGNIYHMWYGGDSQDSIYGQETGYAYSSDGINWTKSLLNPILKKGTAGLWDANTASFPAVILDNGILKMWYTGKDVDPTPPGSLNYYWELGYATDSTFAVGINSINDKKEFLLYPNPFSSATTLHIDHLLHNAALTVYNSFGQIVKQIKNISGQTVAFSRDNLPSGMYILRLTEENKIYTDKLVITD